MIVVVSSTMDGCSLGTEEGWNEGLAVGDEEDVGQFETDGFSVGFG